MFVLRNADDFWDPGNWNAGTAENNAVTGRGKRCTFDERNLCPVNIAYRAFVQRKSYPKQHRILVSQCFLYSNAQGAYQCEHRILFLLSKWIGLYACSDPPHLVDIQNPRAEQETDCDSVDDINRSCTCIPGRAEV